MAIYFHTLIVVVFYLFILSKHTDHRSLYADIDLQGFLRRNPPQLTTAPLRQLQSKNLKAVKQYCDQIYQRLHDEDIESQLSQIQHSIKQPSTKQNSIVKLKELEQKFSQVRLKAEHTLPTGPHHPWSPQLRQAQLLVLYYKLWLSQYSFLT